MQGFLSRPGDLPSFTRRDKGQDSEHTDPPFKLSGLLRSKFTCVAQNLGAFTGCKNRKLTRHPDSLYTPLMLAKVYSAAVHGVDAYEVEIEVNAALEFRSSEHRVLHNSSRSGLIDVMLFASSRAPFPEIRVCTSTPALLPHDILDCF